MKRDIKIVKARVITFPCSCGQGHALRIERDCIKAKVHHEGRKCDSETLLDDFMQKTIKTAADEECARWEIVRVEEPESDIVHCSEACRMKRTA